MTKLKPCPFCGGEAKVKIDKQRMSIPYFTVYCDDCKNGTQWHLNLFYAIKKWNRRVNENAEANTNDR